MRPIIIDGPLGDLARKIGSVQELARRCRVHASTIRRWAKKKPAGLYVVFVNAIAKREKMPPVWPEGANG